MITASFSSGTLSVSGDGLDNTVVVSRTAAGAILINGGAVAITGGLPTVANTTLIELFGQAGKDTITLDESNGGLPRAIIRGGDGDDVLSGGSGGDLLFGDGGNDTLFGKGGFDTLSGGSGNDVLTGGDADDQVSGDGGEDRIVWNPGDDTDLSEGGLAADKAEFNGGNGAEAFTLTANGTRVRFDRVNPAPFAADLGSNESLVLNMGGGDDTFSAAGNLAPLVKLTVDGGAGADTILGSNGADTLLSGDGDDAVDGQQGADLALLGAGNDTFQWDANDGNDTVEGQTGTDTVRFNGSAANEVFAATALGGRVHFTRDIANVTTDINDVEKIDLRALGGADTLTVNNLAGTDVKSVNVDLAGVLGGAVGDGQSDAVIVNATGAANTIDLVGAGGSAAVLGLAAQVSITHADGAADRLIVNGLGGDDVISAATLAPSAIGLTIDGGAGDDIIRGGQGADALLGGDGNDAVFGGHGADFALLGAGDDTFQWSPGEGNDTLEGLAGTDTLLFNGSNASENVDLSANGGRLRLFRDIANVTMDVNDVERVTYNALGGADNVSIGDLSGTDVKEIAIDLGAPTGAGGDARFDAVTLSATNGVDTVAITRVGTTVTVSGLAAKVMLIDAEAADRLTINGFGGADTLNGSTLGAGAIALTLDGGAGADNIRGGTGADTLRGGEDADILRGGAGADTFEGGNGVDMIFGGDGDDFANAVTGGDDIYFGGAGDDFFFGFTGAETLRGEAGNDTLKGFTGDDLLVGGAGGDALDGGAGSDTVDYSASQAGVVVSLSSQGGLGSGGEAQGDTLVAVENVTGSAFKDIMSASGSNANRLIGGGGDDVLTGGDGGDTLSGDSGADSLKGGSGGDVLKGGTGIDTLSYTDSSAGVTIFLEENVASGGFASGDVISQFENVTGSAFGDILRGTNTANVLRGLVGNDKLLGLGGADTFVGGDGADVMDGGDGIDTVDYSLSNKGIAVNLFGQSEFFAGDAAGDSLSNIENIVGTSFNDMIDGANGDNALFGGFGHDTLIGDQGIDHLTGGADDDEFLFFRIGDSGKTAATRDVIEDFSVIEGDRILLHTIDANVLSNADEKFAFIGSGAFTAAGQVRAFFEGPDTVVELNNSGSSGAEMQFEIAGHVSLTSLDFSL